MLPQQPNAEPGAISRCSSEGSIHIAKSDLKHLENKIDTLGVKVDGLGQKIDGLGGKIDGLGEKVDELGRKIDVLGQKVDLGFQTLGRTVENGFQYLARQNESMVAILQQIQATNLQLLAGNQQLITLLIPRLTG